MGGETRRESPGCHQRFVVVADDMTQSGNREGEKRRIGSRRGGDIRVSEETYGQGFDLSAARRDGGGGGGRVGEQRWIGMDGRLARIAHWVLFEVVRATPQRTSNFSIIGSGPSLTSLISTFGTRLFMNRSEASSVISNIPNSVTFPTH